MTTPLRALLVASALAALPMGSACAQVITKPSLPGAADYTPHPGQAGKDVVWVPTPQTLVDNMLDMAGATKDDYLIDLGSGDGRTVITAARRGIRARGIEYNADMVALSKRQAAAEGVGDKVVFDQADIFETDFSDATVLTLFLLPELNLRLRPIILDMKPGTRVVSNSFDMAEWKADAGTDGGKDGCTSWCRAYLWIVPAKVDGHWRLGDGTLELKQTFQMLEGSLTRGGQAVPISEAKLRGTEIVFTAGGRRYTGQATGDAMSGQVDGGQWSAVRQPR